MENIMWKKVSLILTSYNCEENITRTLKSIELQDYPNIEVIVIDGLSTDKTVEVIKEFERKTKYECRWVSEKDNGLYDAMNKGLKIASGEILAFFNDLFLMSNAVSLMVSAIEEGEYDGAHADLIYAKDDRVKRYWKMGQGMINSGWMPGHPTLFLKKQVYEKYGMYNTDYKCSADYEFMVRILREGAVKLNYVPHTIIRMFYGGTSTKNPGSYWVSIKESYKALQQYNIQHAIWIIFRRTLKVLAQFTKAHKFEGEYNQCSL